MNYIAQNKLGFEGDVFAKEKMKHIIESNGIKTIVETGTYLGSTTKWFSQWADKVHTFEVKQDHFNKAKEALKGCNNITMHLGNSAYELSKVIGDLSDKTFFFLDAHWEDYNPLLDELKVIADSGLKPIIAIHDFKVPDHPELGFDSYKGQDYDLEWIKPSLKLIYGEDYLIKYNTEATGAKRGIIYIYP